MWGWGRAESIREGKIILAKGIGGIGTRSPGSRKGNAVTGRENQAELPAIGYPFGRSGPGLHARNFPIGVEDQGAPDVKVGEPASQPEIEMVQTGDGIAEGVAGEGGRTGVNALGPREGALGLKTVAHALRQLRFESIVVGPPFIKHSPNGAIVCVDV